MHWPWHLLGPNSRSVFSLRKVSSTWFHPPPPPPARKEASRDSWCGQPLPAPLVCRQLGSMFLNTTHFSSPLRGLEERT